MINFNFVKLKLINTYIKDINMTSPYVKRPMANTVEMQIAEGCKSYDLYITSEFRRSMFVEGKMKDDDTTVRVSTLNMMYNDNREKYDEMIKAMDDDRYADDPAYREAILDKLERSDINF